MKTELNDVTTSSSSRLSCANCVHYTSVVNTTTVRSETQHVFHTQLPMKSVDRFNFLVSKFVVYEATQEKET